MGRNVGLCVHLITRSIPSHPVQSLCEYFLYTQTLSMFKLYINCFIVLLNEMYKIKPRADENVLFHFGTRTASVRVVYFNLTNI